MVLSWVFHRQRVVWKFHPPCLGNFLFCLNGGTIRSGLVPFDQPISRVWNYYAKMMHCTQIIALNVCFFGGVLVLFYFSSVTMCAYYACYGVEIKKLFCLVLSCQLN